MTTRLFWWQDTFFSQLKQTRFYYCLSVLLLNLFSITVHSSSVIKPHHHRVLYFFFNILNLQHWCTHDPQLLWLKVKCKKWPWGPNVTSFNKSYQLIINLKKVSKSCIYFSYTFQYSNKCVRHIKCRTFESNHNVNFINILITKYY